MNYRIGIDFGGTGIKSGVIDAENRLIGKASLPTGVGRPYEEIVADIARTAELAATDAGLAISDFPCLGIGSPGCVNPRNGEMVFLGNLNWHNAPLGQSLSALLGIPVFVGNDANCAIAGEVIAGAARGCKHALMLTLGTGVGGGVVLDSKLYLGGDGMGTEFGHTPFLFGGEPCTCGARGCFEAYASVTALIRQTKAAMAAHPESLMHASLAEHGKVSGRTAFDCARKGDAAASSVVDTYIEYVACGIGGFINVFRPEIVLIGGGISNEGDFLIRPLNDKIKRYVFSHDIIGVPRIAAATLGNDAGIIGAAHLDQM